jgi:hypothetical protein
MVEQLTDTISVDDCDRCMEDFADLHQMIRDKYPEGG